MLGIKFEHPQPMYKLQILLFVLLATNAVAQPPGADSTRWKLFFADDFDGNRLDRSKWDIRFPWNQPANDETCVCNCNTDNPIKSKVAYRIFQNDTHNIKVYDGTLKLFARKEEFMGEFWDWDKEGVFTVSHHSVDYTSSLIYSKQKFRRGYFEIRFKLPPAPKFPKTHAGIGVNFWMYTGDCWSEIDGFEFVNMQNREYTTSVHYAPLPTGIGDDTTCTQRRDVQGNNFGTISDDEWHIAGFDWGNDKVIFYLDGQVVFTADRNIANLKAMPLIVNMNVPPDGGCISIDSRRNEWPYKFEVDYIRVWKRIGN